MTTTPPEPDRGDRDELRVRLRAARRAIEGQRRVDAERRIARSLVDLVERVVPATGAPSGGTRGRVALSTPTDGEVDVGPAMRELHAAGWEIHLPVVGPQRSMEFVPWHPGAPLHTNRYGIAEPVSGPRRAAADLDVVVLPCVGVDERGHRLGFGAGFYDRALEGGDHGVLIAAVFEAQVVDRLVPASHDVPVDVVVTEVAVRRVAAT